MKINKNAKDITEETLQLEQPDKKYCIKCRKLKNRSDFGPATESAKSSRPLANRYGVISYCKKCMASYVYNRKFEYPKTLAGYMVNKIKQRAHHENMEFNLDKAWMLEKLLIGKCSLSGIPFLISKSKDENNYAREFHPSVDRIDSTKGYTKDNCRLVCVHLNYAKNAWSDLNLFKIAVKLLKYQANLLETSLPELIEKLETLPFDNP